MSLLSALLSTILITNGKSLWSDFFWFVKVYILWKCIQYIIHCDIKIVLKKFPSDKINGTKNALFFLLQASTYHSFTFNLRFSYELKHKVRLFKTVRGIFHFRFRFVFVKFIFLFNKIHELFDCKTSLFLLKLK